MGTHGRPVMGSHRPGPMGPSIVPSPPPGWPDVARSQDFESSVAYPLMKLPCRVASKARYRISSDYRSVNNEQSQASLERTPSTPCSHTLRSLSRVKCTVCTTQSQIFSPAETIRSPVPMAWHTLRQSPACSWWCSG